MPLNSNNKPYSLTQEEEILWSIYEQISNPAFGTNAEWGLITGDITNQAEYGTANGMATLDATGKLPSSQLPVEVVEYKGAWNALINSPTLSDVTGTTGDQYKVNVAGTQDLGSGSIDYEEGDLLIHNGTIWEHFPRDASASYIYVNTLHVAENASGTSGVKGDRNNPFSLEEAIGAVANEDHIIVEAGTYNVNFTIDAILTAGVTDFVITAEGPVTINTSTVGFVNDTTGKSYKIEGDFNILGHSGASLFTFAHANSTISIKARRLENDGNTIATTTAGSPTIQWDLAVISNFYAFTGSNSTMHLICGDVDGSVGGTFHRPNVACFDTLIANDKIGTPIIFCASNIINIAGSATATDRNPTYRGLSFVNDTTSISHVVLNRRNSRLEFENCTFTNNANGFRCCSNSAQGTVIPIRYKFRDCNFVNNGTTAGSNGIDMSSLPAGSMASFELIMKGSNIFEITEAASLAIQHATATLNAKTIGYAGGNKDVGVNVNFLVGNFEFNTNIEV